MDRPGRAFLRLIGLAAFVLLVFIVLSFMLLKLGAAPTVVLLGGPDGVGDDRTLLAIDYGLNQPAIIQLVRYAARTLTGEFGRSWLSGDPVLGELLARLPATLELMIYALLLGALIGAPGRNPHTDGPGATLLLLLFNAEDLDTDFRLPEGDWRLLLNTAADDTIAPGAEDQPLPIMSGHCALSARSVMLLARRRPSQPNPGASTP